MEIVVRLIGPERNISLRKYYSRHVPSDFSLFTAYKETFEAISNNSRDKSTNVPASFPSC